VGEPWPDIPCEFWHWVNTRSVQSQALWGAGVFATTVHYDSSPNHDWDSQYIKLLDVTFHSGDLAALLGTSGTAPVLGSLPGNAKPNDRRYERAAHHAADLVRKKGSSREEAFRQALLLGPKAENVEQASRVRALRHAYDLMYDPYGIPIKKDQD